MKQGYTDISIVLDRSGSMESVKHDVIGGFNQFLRDQQAVPGEATISLAQFDDVYEVVYQGRDLQDVPELDETTFVPRGSTALLDAIGRTINTTGKRLRAMPEAKRPGKVVFVIQTDGEENASRKYPLSKINEMIRHQTDVYNWQFVFLGANQDAIASACAMGIDAGSALTFVNDAEGVKSVYKSVSQSLTGFRQGRANKVGFGVADRKKQQRVAS